MPTSSREKPRLQTLEKFKSPQDELDYLRSRVAEKEYELETLGNRDDYDRIAKRELALYADVPAATILHETIIMPEHEKLRQILKLEPEIHDRQMDGLLDVIRERGIKNALAIVARMQNPHLEDDLHRILVRYIAEGLPDSSGIPEVVRRALNLVLYEVRPQAYGEEGAEKSNQKLEQVLASSTQLYSGLLSLLGQGESFSLEIAVPEGTEEAMLYLAVSREKAAIAERLIGSVFPHAILFEKRGDYNIFNVEGVHAAAYATLANHPCLPVNSYESFEHDPLNLVLASFAKIAKHGEGAALQILVGNEGDRYNKYYKKIHRALEDGKSLGEAEKVPETVLGEVTKDIFKSIFSSNSEIPEKQHAVDKAAADGVGHKISTRIVPTIIRLAVSAKDEARADELLSNIESPFTQFDNTQGNRFVFKKISNWNLIGFLRDFTFRSFESSIAIPLSLAEITTLFHFNAERVTTSRELKKSYGKSAPAPTGMRSEGITMGLNQYGATQTPVHFAEKDRLRHCYVIGQTGTGKSIFLRNMMLQDIKNGDGVAFIDPHGNDIEEILGLIPPERMKDVIYFDPAHTDRPMGLNMLEYDINRPEMKSLVVDEVYGIFRKLYSDVPDAFGPMFEQYYRNAVQLVLEDPSSGSTFLEIARVFADADFRNHKLAHCNNPIVVQFWKKIAEAAQGDASLSEIAPYITSKFDVFLSNDIMRPIVAQEKSAFNFREIMDGKKIFLANLSKGRLGDKNASLLGLVLVSKFLQAAFSRADTRDALPTFYLYIDEFQNFATPSIATILSEARKYKLSLVIAHQFIAQLEDNIRDAVVGNVGTKVAFRVGTTDAEFLEKQFAPTFTAKDLEHLPNYNAVLALLVDGTPTTPFSLQSIPVAPPDFSQVDALKEMSYEKYGADREAVEKMINAKFALADR